MPPVATSELKSLFLTPSTKPLTCSCSPCILQKYTKILQTELNPTELKLRDLSMVIKKSPRVFNKELIVLSLNENTHNTHSGTLQTI